MWRWRNSPRPVPRAPRDRATRHSHCDVGLLVTSQASTRRGVALAQQMPQPGGVIAWVLGVVLPAAVLIAAVELWSRWWIRRRTGYYVWAPGLRLDMRQVPEVFPGVEPRVRFEVNADGERGSDVPGDEPGLFRVLVAGGSAVECFSLDQQTSWPGALERLLNTDASLRILGATRVHVGNIGRSGIASYHLDLIFEHVLPRYGRLAAIAILVGTSDMLTWLEDGAPRSLPVSSASVAETFEWHPQESFGWAPSRWAVINLARRLRQSWLRPVEVRERAGTWVPAARKMRAQAKELRTAVPDPTLILDRFDRHFRRLLQRAKAHADRVLVVRQPWLEKEYTAVEEAQFWHGGVGKAWKETISVFYAQRVLNHLMGRIDARAAALADELGVEHLNLRAVLTPSLENYYDCFHATPAGAAVIARAVAAALWRRRPPARPSLAPALAAASADMVSAG